MCCWFEFGCPHYSWLLHAVTPSWGSSNSPDPLLLSIVIYCLLPQLAAHFGNGLSSKKPPVFSWSGDSTVGIVLTTKQWIGVVKNDRKMGVEYLTSKEFDSFYYNKKIFSRICWDFQSIKTRLPVTIGQVLLTLRAENKCTLSCLAAASSGSLSPSGGYPK